MGGFLKTTLIFFFFILSPFLLPIVAANIMILQQNTKKANAKTLI
jgi:hypothetical protein